jgi:hypothetical protein
VPVRISRSKYLALYCPSCEAVVPCTCRSVFRADEPVSSVRLTATAAGNDDARQNTALFCLRESCIHTAFGTIILYIAIINSLNSMKKAMFSVLR